MSDAINLSDATCEHRASGSGYYRSRLCGKPAKGFLTGSLYKGKPGCGIHLAAERRVKENEEKREEEYQARCARRKPLIDLCDELGITRLVDWEGRYINLGLADAKALLARLKANG